MRLRQLIPNNTFSRGVAVLFGGSASAQLLLLLAAPILTRLYSPDDFGVLAVFVAIFSILTVIVSLRFELAIPIADDSQTALSLVVLCLLLTIVFALIGAIVVLALGDSLAALVNLRQYADYLWALPLGILLIGTHQTFKYWATREKAFASIAKTKITQSLGTLIIQMSSFKLGPLGLLAGYITGQIIGTSQLVGNAAKSFTRQPTTFNQIKYAASRYRRFPIFTIWASIFNSVGMQLPILIFSSFFGLHAVGLYSLANRLLNIPGTLLSQAFSQVFLSHGSAFNREGTLGRNVDHFLGILIGIGLPPLILMLVCAPLLFKTIFGEEWVQAGEVAQWMAISVFFKFCNTPLTVFLVLERQELGLYMQLFLLGLRAIGITLGIIYSDFIGTIILYSVMSAIGYLVFLLIKVRISGGRVVRFFSNILYYLALSIGAFLPIFITEFNNVSWASLLPIFLTFIILFFYYLSIFKRLNLQNVP